MQWSSQQHAIFEWFAHGREQLIVRARAGTGKTTTIVEGIERAPEGSILLAAFNKRIAEELTRRLVNPRAQAKTLHAIGFSCVRRYWEGLSIAKGNARAWRLAELACGAQGPDPIKRLVAKLHTKGREILPHATRLGDLTELAVTFECEPDETWTRDGFDLAYVEAAALKAMAIAAADRPVDTGIDFADMIFLPVRNAWLRPQYDLVVVDEAQDMTLAQLEIALGVSSGRICVVGDDRQAIYAFRGADADSLDRLKTSLHAQELGLTVTYRCGRAITERAATLVPDFVAAPDSPAGTIEAIGSDDLVAAVRLGDFVLSRKNAPLASIAMAMIRAQVRVRIAGRDIGAGLQAIVRDLSKDGAANSIPAFLDRLIHWEAREVTRALRANREERAETVRDQSATLQVLCEGVSGLRELGARIDALFTDDGLGASGVVTCSSVHKAKGLEADRVFLLVDTLYPALGVGRTRTAAQRREEANIEYVAITRAKSTLVLVSGVVIPAARATVAPLFAAAGV